MGTPGPFAQHRPLPLERVGIQGEAQVLWELWVAVPTGPGSEDSTAWAGNALTQHREKALSQVPPT